MLKIHTLLFAVLAGFALLFSSCASQSGTTTTTATTSTSPLNRNGSNGLASYMH